MKKKIVYIVLAVVVMIAAGCGFYINDYYRAEEEAISCMAEPDGNVNVVEDEGRIVFVPEKPEAGLIFYPGGKVEYSAYAPLMEACAQRGILCVLVEMPGNLAVLDMDAADGIIEEIGGIYGEIDKWYMAGHSLGGSMAASYVEENHGEFEGLVLLAAYSTAELTDTELEVLSIYGDYDEVLNMEKYEKYRGNLPENMKEVVIEGGCHAYFGKYGMQEGDGQPTISQEKQIEITAEAIEAFAKI